MKRNAFRLKGLFLLFLSATLIAGCDDVKPSLFSSPVSTPPATLTSVLPTPPIVTVHNKIMLALYPTDMVSKAALYISSPDGSNLQRLIEISPDPGSVLISPNQRFAAFFTSGTTSEGALMVWDLISRKTLFAIPVQAEISTSFRDAPPVRYLAWSLDNQNLAIVMNRDLYLVNVGRQEINLLVRHQEERYNLAGLVMGTINHPTWTTDGKGIVYDTFSPPDILSASADQYRDVEYVDISTGARRVLLTDAHILQQMLTSDKRELLIQSQDGRYFLLDLTTLKLLEHALPDEPQAQYLCDSQNRYCASISSDRRNYDSLYLKLPDSYIKVSIEDISEAPDCQFQSILWGSEGDVLLVTVGCPGRADLWSLRTSNLQFVQLRRWTGTNMAILLSRLE